VEASEVVDPAPRQRHGPYPDGIETLPTGWAIVIALAIVGGGAAAATALWLRRQRLPTSQMHRPIDAITQSVEMV
jgi:hypothetical protein